MALRIIDILSTIESNLNGLSSLLLAYAICEMHEPEAIKLAVSLLDQENESIQAVKTNLLETFEIR